MVQLARGWRMEFGDAQIKATVLVRSSAYAATWPMARTTDEVSRRGLLVTHLVEYCDQDLDGLVIRRGRPGRAQPYLYWVEPTN